jgi:predicted transcriptional regulator
MADNEQSDLTSLTVDLLSAYFASNSVESEQLSGLIRSTHDALKGLTAEPASTEAASEHVPAVSVRKSLASPDHILSMIDGRPYKTLKRHIGSHGLTPAEYRERFKLPSDYPLVSRNYSEHRRNVAARLGLGRKVRSPKPADVAAPVETKVSEQTATKKPAAAKAKAAAAAAPKAKTATTTAAKPARASKAAQSAAPVKAPAVEASTTAPAKKAPVRKAKLSIATPKA